MKICSYYPFPKSLSQERDLVASLLILNCISSKSMSLNQEPVSREGHEYENMFISPFP